MATLPPPSSPTVSAIYAAYESAADAGYRAHLGASLIGGECERAIWYSFRWATRARHTGRLLRLFETGHLAEARFVADLRRIGVTVLDVDPATGRQWTLRDAGGHFGGSMDAVAKGFPEAPQTWHVCEFKTHSAKSFAALTAEGVEKSKPLHWAQMQAYMQLAGLDRAFYLAVCKDTDALYQERTRHDPGAGLRILAKAARIIGATRPPARISQDPAWWQCRRCDHHAVCHGGAAPERHCRSCLHASPVQGGDWHCARHAAPLDRRMQEAGCAAHLYLPDFVAAEQIDAGEDWVSYRLADGTEWRDGVPAAVAPAVVSHGPCNRCGGNAYVVRPGKGPHAFGLTCTSCGSAGRWLGKAAAAAAGIAA
ncbi:MAG: oxidoreductase [Acetobacteraceae bacterium]|nr:oxidoreductase [Acetobacteraceae bacterium]